MAVRHRKDIIRDARAIRWAIDLQQDLKYAFRMIRRDPALDAAVGSAVPALEPAHAGPVPCSHCTPLIHVGADRVRVGIRRL